MTDFGVPEETLPEDWRVLWCKDCGYSITFTEAEVDDAPDGNQWHALMLWAIAHVCRTDS